MLCPKCGKNLNGVETCGCGFRPLEDTVVILGNPDKYINAVTLTARIKIRKEEQDANKLRAASLETQLEDMKSLMEKLQAELAALEKKQKPDKGKSTSMLQAKVGDIVQLGRYEQGNGVEPIAWRVLDRQGNKILLISQYAIDYKSYNGEFNYNMVAAKPTSWEECDLRKWLNREFLNMAFNETERSMIANTKCPVDQNPIYRTSPGNATTDKIFLLSIPEVEQYFKSKEDRKAVPTAYANKHDPFHPVAGAACWWWLRSPGYDSINAAYVNFEGSVAYDGLYVFNDCACVRPALWINLES